MKSRAPEYSGSGDLPASADPRTLSTIAGEATPPTTTSADARVGPPAIDVTRLPGAPILTKEGLYSFTGEGLELTVDPRRGSVVRFSLEGREALLDPDANPEDYTTELEGSTLVLKGAEGNLTKRFRLDTARRLVEITWTIGNPTSNASRTNVADVHRVASNGGLTFFSGSPPLLPGSTLKLDVGQPIVWFAHTQAREPKALQASVESPEGWVATINDGLVLVKVASDARRPVISVSSEYDGATKRRPWVEVGAKGRFDVSPHASATCKVRLFLRELPLSLAPKPGNQELVGFVRGVIQ